MGDGDAAPYFFTTFDCTQAQGAQAAVCGLGYYELYINGRPVGDRVLEPIVSPNKRISNKWNAVLDMRGGFLIKSALPEPEKKRNSLMDAYAVIQTGGKQYRVEAGQTIEIERLDTEAGQDVELKTVMALSDGASLKVGVPFVDGAVVVLEIKEHFRGDKVINYKKKRRKGYHRLIGHRQELTRAVVKSIA